MSLNRDDAECVQYGFVRNCVTAVSAGRCWLLGTELLAGIGPHRYELALRSLNAGTSEGVGRGFLSAVVPSTQRGWVQNSRQDMSDTTDSLIAALNAAGVKSDNHVFIQRLMSAVGIAAYEAKKQKTESYVIATRRDGLPNVRIYFGYTTGFTTAEEAARLAREFGVETGPSGKLKGKWFVGHPINGGLGPRASTTRTKKPQQTVRCPKCSIWELSASGRCPDCDEDDVRRVQPPELGPKLNKERDARPPHVTESDRPEDAGNGRREVRDDIGPEKVRRPSTRTDCPQCGRRILIQSDGTLKSHLVRKPTDSEQGPNIPRCPGGFMPPIGQVVRVEPEPVIAQPQPPRLLEEGSSSVRAMGTGLPGSNRRRH